MSESGELKKLYRLQQARTNDVISAKVISSGKDPLSDKLIINKGSLDGLKVRDAVIDRGELVGQLTQALPCSSEVTLLYNSQNTVSIMVARTGERNLLYGGDNKFDLRCFSSALNLKAEDILLTSGLDSVYPVDIPVATVDTIGRSSGSPYYIVSLSPFVTLHGSRFMLVVSQPKSQITEPQQQIYE